MIDLHSHTTESDGTDSPEELIRIAVQIGLEALAITDHDTLAGYRKARPYAEAVDLPLLCGIELSTRFRGRSVHLLGYFPKGEPAAPFVAWLTELQQSRKDRNRRMAERLQALGIPITLEEVERKGRSMAGRPHFARVLMEKGYVSSIQQAFEEYLDESAKGYVERQEADFAESVALIAASGGVASVAHPIRLLRNAAEPLRDTIRAMRDAGLPALEAYHSDHRPADVRFYEALAREFGIGVTGGSDYHGLNKPNIRLGTGASGNLDVQMDVLISLRRLAA
ncbi:MAG: PHP domain-containing protein [Acidobacteriota bacterium]|nr:PHP domain-containing protein [Acidobacteriota bacterium]